MPTTDRITWLALMIQPSAIMDFSICVVPDIFEGGNMRARVRYDFIKQVKLRDIIGQTKLASKNDGMVPISVQ
jgi:hypothetical protein